MRQGRFMSQFRMRGPLVVAMVVLRHGVYTALVALGAVHQAAGHMGLVPQWDVEEGHAAQAYAGGQNGRKYGIGGCSHCLAP
jgi:hypothetical protein